MKQIRLLFALLAVTLLAGCGTLAPNGPYGGDRALYDADLTITTSYDAFHNFVTWEYQNRQALAQWPEIKLAADHVRRNGRQWITSATALRDAYAANPSSGTRDALNTSVSVIRAALMEATRYMSTAQVTTSPTPN